MRPQFIIFFKFTFEPYLYMKKDLSPVAELNFDEKDSVLYIKMLEGAVLNLANTKQHARQMEELTLGKPYLALIDATNFFTMDEESLKFSSAPIKPPNRIAGACFNPTLANRFTVEIFRKFGNPKYPMEVFNTKAEAIQWLKKQVKLKTIK